MEIERSLPKSALLIDGANVHGMCRMLGFQIDWSALLRHWGRKNFILRAYYFTAIDEEAEFQSLRPLIDWLAYNGFDPQTKPTKKFTDSSGARRVKGNMDVEIAVVAMQLIGKVDEIALFSGDGDFTYLVEALKRAGVRVTIVSTIKSNPPMAADELRRAADEFVELEGIRPLIEKKEGKGRDTISLKK